MVHLLRKLRAHAPTRGGSTVEGAGLAVPAEPRERVVTVPRAGKAEGAGINCAGDAQGAGLTEPAKAEGARVNRASGAEGAGLIMTWSIERLSCERPVGSSESQKSIAISGSTCLSTKSAWACAWMIDDPAP